MITLRDGSCTNDRRLDRVRQVDARSLAWPISDKLTADQYTNPRSYTWRLTTFLNQGEDGACVGFAYAHELAARPGIVTGIDNTFALQRLYWNAQQADDWPGGEYPEASPVYSGTSVLAGAKVCVQLGFYHEYRWALNLRDLVTAVGYHGPAVIGVDWYTGMMDVDEHGFVTPSGQVEGGHCVCVPGVRIVRDDNGEPDALRSYFIVHNSWGSGWGVAGRCRIAFADMLTLWPGADLCIPIGRVTATAG